VKRKKEAIGTHPPAESTDPLNYTPTPTATPTRTKIADERPYTVDMWAEN
jgi:hypothetical protein